MTLLRPIHNMLIFLVWLYLYAHHNAHDDRVRAILPFVDVDVDPSKSRPIHEMSTSSITIMVSAFAMVVPPRRPKVPVSAAASFAKRMRLYTSSSSSSHPPAEARRRQERGAYHGRQSYSKPDFKEKGNRNLSQTVHTNSVPSSSSRRSVSPSSLQRNAQLIQHHEERRQQDLVVLFQNALDKKYDSNTEIDQSMLQLAAQQTDKENVTQTLVTMLSCPDSSKLAFSLSRALLLQQVVVVNEDDNQHGEGNDHINLALCAFIKALANRRAFIAMETFVRHTLPPSLQTCTLYSTAMAALTSTRTLHHNQRHEHHNHYGYRFCRHDSIHKQSARALRLWNDMRRLELVPTSYTLTALFRAMNGPQQVWDFCTQVRGQYDQDNNLNISTSGSSSWTRPVYEAAIRACTRGTVQQSQKMAWDTALQIWQWMLDDNKNNTSIHPTVDTYRALLQVCAVTGNVTAALHLLDHEILADTVSIKSLDDVVDDQIRRRAMIQKHPLLWDAMLHVCVSNHDDATCLHILHRMYHEMEVRPNVHHCTAYLKCLSLLKKDAQAVDFVMNIMMMSPSSSAAINGDSGIDDSHKPLLQTAPPDLVAIHTALAACASTRNYKMARKLFDNIVQHYRYGDHNGHNNKMAIQPNQQTYHLILAACQNGQQARDVIREMRLSRRHRPGGRALTIGATTRHVVVPPNIISYTKAIVACRQVGDLETALWLLRTAILDDGLEPDVYIYSAVIWTAAAAKDWPQARALLKEMKLRGCMPSIISYNGLLAALSDSDNAEHPFELALVVLDEIHDGGLVSTKSTFSQLARLATMTASGTEQQRRLARLERIYHDKMTLEEKQQVAIGGPVLQALINAYGAQGHYAQARQVFDTISSSCNDIGCVRAMLFACSTAKPQPAWQQALEILHSTTYTMPSGSGDNDTSTVVCPTFADAVSVSSTMLTCSKADRWQESLELWRVFTHDDGGDKRSNITISLLALNSLIAACGRAGRADIAIQVLNDMESGGRQGRGNVLPDERSFRNAIIACNQAEHALRRLERRQHSSRHRKASKQKDYSKLSNGLFEWWECALSLLRRMQENGLSPDIQTFSSAISACEAAGQWQRALGVLQSILDDNDDDTKDSDCGLNLYCFNAAMSACQKGGAWVECLELYEKMKTHGGVLTPNSVSLSSLVLACEEAGQKELALEKYKEGLKRGIIPSPWRTTTMATTATSRNATTTRRVVVPVRAMDLHHYSAAMAKAAVRSYLDSLLASGSSALIGDTGWTIIVGKGLRSRDNEPVLLPTLLRLLEHEYGIVVSKPKSEDGENNTGRLVVDADTLRQFVASKSW